MADKTTYTIDHVLCDDPSMAKAYVRQDLDSEEANIAWERHLEKLKERASKEDADHYIFLRMRDNAGQVMDQKYLTCPHGTSL